MAVWDQFLTERDRVHLDRGWAKRHSFGLGDRPALLVIDNQQTMFGDRPLPFLDAVAEFPARFGEEGWAAVRATVPVIAAARAAQVPVVYTATGGPVPSLFRPAGHLSSGRPAFSLDDMRRVEIHRDIAPEPGDLVIYKGGASAFFGTTLDAALRRAGVDTLLVCGNSTSGCVRQTVGDAAARQFRTAVIEECTFDRTEASHAMSLFDMHQKYSDVISADDAIGYLAGPRPAAP